MTEKVRKHAQISECGKYRFWLERQWGKGFPLVFVMLNPSTADAELDDATIRRCIGYAKREGAGGLIVANLFAYRATNPKELETAEHPTGGPANTHALGEAMMMAKTFSRPIICAWGGNPYAVKEAAKFALRAKDFDVDLLCLGTTKDGAPRHPVRLRKDEPLVPYVGLSDD